MRIFLVPFAAAAMFAMANFGASAMSISQANGIRAGDQAVLAWHQSLGNSVKVEPGH